MGAMTGRGILSGIEETSLEDVLDSFRKLYHADQGGHIKYVKPTHWDALDDLVAHHFRATQSPSLSVRGRPLPLLYRIISALVSAPHCLCVFVLDLEGRFDATRLTCAEEDLQHVYVQQPRNNNSTSRSGGGGGDAQEDRPTSFLVAEAESFMLYSQTARGSSSRQWWGCIVVGGDGAGGRAGGGDLMAGWKGWLRVDREHVPGFAPGTSLETACEQRAARERAVEAAGWAATSPWGSMIFHEEDYEQKTVS